jgi:SNF2 family DNA or RNA helicase
MISWTVTEEGLVFRFLHEEGVAEKGCAEKGCALPLSDWLYPPEGRSEEGKSEGGRFDPKVDLLRELLENGQASQVDETALCVPHEEICELHQLDRQLLGLPPVYPFEIRLDAEGVLHEPHFRYHWGFYEYAQGKQFRAHRQGCILSLEGLESAESYLLTPAQLRLAKSLDEFNALSPETKTAEENFLHFSKIKEMTKEAGAVMDAYLEGEEVVNPERISLKMKMLHDGSMEILPEIDGAESEKFEKKFDRMPMVQPSYTLRTADDRHTRVVFTRQQQDELRKVKDHHRLRGERLKEFLDAPQRIFDPGIKGGIDLDSFSERVKEVGPYRPRYTPFLISYYRSQWLPDRIENQSGDQPGDQSENQSGYQPEEFKPGVLIEDATTGNQERILFTPEMLNEFSQALSEAKENGQASINWNGKPITLEDAEKVQEAAMIAVHASDEKRDTTQSDTQRNARLVLIVKENLDELEYSEEGKVDGAGLDSFTGSNSFAGSDSLNHFTRPANLKETIQLYDHQKEGIGWLQSLYEQGCSGALLADDMGLGKTLQILGFLEWHNTVHNTDNKPYLIVAPLTLLDNWAREYRFFFDPCSLPLVQLNSQTIARSEALSRRQIILTTYETLRGNCQFDLGRIDWAIAVLDEAQRIKTPSTLVTNAAKTLKAGFKIASTGTPVENTWVDLWCIMDFLVPGPLMGSLKDFGREFQAPLKKADTDLNELGERLRKKVSFYLKRRLKTDTLQGLPPKRIHLRRRLMPEIQLRRYLMEIGQARSEIARYKSIGQGALTLDELTGQEGLAGRDDLVNQEYSASQQDSPVQEDSSRQKNSPVQEHKNQVRPKDDAAQKFFFILHRLRDICDHPFLPDQQIEASDCGRLIASSAKLQETVEILREIQAKGEKVILFTEWDKTQRLLARVIREQFGFSPSILNGKTPVERTGRPSARETRQQAIERFQQKPGFNAIVISPLVAGFGLNITAANHVIHYSRHWNPAKEDQATDRVYRIGQNKEVHIYLPIAVAPDFGTFDAVLNDRLEKKRSLAKASLFPTERAKVNPEDLYKAVMGEGAFMSEGIMTGEKLPSAPSPDPTFPPSLCPAPALSPMQLSLADFDTLEPGLFESAIAALWQKAGYEVRVTPAVHNQGANVLAFSEGKNLLMRVKQSSNSPLDAAPISEVLTACAFFGKEQQKTFCPLVVTNSSFTSQAKNAADSNCVELIDRQKLASYIEHHPLLLAEVWAIEHQRMKRLRA